MTVEKPPPGLLENLPNYVVIAPDSNGRWVESYGWPRIEGHCVGVNFLLWQTACSVYHFTRSFGQTFVSVTWTEHAYRTVNDKDGLAGWSSGQHA